jgi:hypothetical protein
MSMKRFFRILPYLYAAAAHCGWLYGLLVITSFPELNYWWTSEEDVIIGRVPDPPTDESVLFIAFVLIAIVVSQLVIAVMSKRTWVKAVSGILVVLALLIWGVRFAA